MKYNKNKLAMIILTGVIIISACTQSYSQSPAATPTLIPPDLFVAPFPSADSPMKMIEDFAKGTATAAGLTAAASGGTPVTPETVTPVTFTVTPITFTPTLTPVVAPVCTAPACSGVGYKLTCPSGNCVGGCGYVCTFEQTPAPPAAPPLASGNVYYLKAYEFPFCIARRFAVDPDDMVYNKSSIYYEGFPINMPQNSSWPASAGPIDLRAHPDTYIVTGNADTTVYGVACKYGHVDPALIAQNNGISASAVLTIGQQLKIP